MNKLYNKLKSGLFVAVAGLMAFGLALSSAPAEANKAEPETFKYVSLGDSMTTGFGFDDYYVDNDPAEIKTGYEKKENGNLNVRGFMTNASECYPALIANDLEARLGVDVEWTQLAGNAMRIDDIYFALGEEPNNPEGYYDNIFNPSNEDGEKWFNVFGARANKINGTTLDAYDSVHSTFVNSVEEADLITLNAGFNNFGAYITGRLGYIIPGNPILNAKWAGNDTLQDFVDEIGADYNIEDLYAQVYKFLDVELGLGIEEKYKQFNFNGMVVNGEMFADALIRSFISYCYYMNQTTKLIHEINPDATLLVLGLYNQYDDVSAVYGGKEFNVGKLYDYLFQAANLYTCGLTEYAHKFYFIDLQDVEIENHIDGLKDVSTLPEALQTRLFEEVSNLLVNQFKLADANNPEGFKPSDIKDYYEDDTIRSARAFVARYLIENIEYAMDDGAINFDNLLKLASDLSEIDSMTVTEALDLFEDYSYLSDFLKVYFRLLAGNGMWSHPNAKGHRAIADKVMEFLADENKVNARTYFFGMVYAKAEEIVGPFIPMLQQIAQNQENTFLETFVYSEIERLNGIGQEVLGAQYSLLLEECATFKDALFTLIEEASNDEIGYGLAYLGYHMIDTIVMNELKFAGTVGYDAAKAILRGQINQIRKLRDFIKGDLKKVLYAVDHCIDSLLEPFDGAIKEQYADLVAKCKVELSEAEAKGREIFEETTTKVDNKVREFIASAKESTEAAIANAKVELKRIFFSINDEAEQDVEISKSVIESAYNSIVRCIEWGLEPENFDAVCDYHNKQFAYACDVYSKIKQKIVWGLGAVALVALDYEDDNTLNMLREAYNFGVNLDDQIIDVLDYIGSIWPFHPHDAVLYDWNVDGQSSTGTVSAYTQCKMCGYEMYETADAYGVYYESPDEYCYGYYEYYAFFNDWRLGFIVTKTYPETPTSHVVGDWVNTDRTYHWHKCTNSGEETTKLVKNSNGVWVRSETGDLHEYTLQKTEWGKDASGNWTAKMYLECECGHKKDANPEVATSVTVSRFKNPTCTTNGVTKYEAVFPTYGKVVRFEADVNKLGHDEATTWTTSALKHWHVCNHEGCTEKFDEDYHVFDPESADYSWSADGKTCTLTVKCSTCNYTYSETVTSTSSVKAKPTCLNKGTTEYKATFHMDVNTIKNKDATKNVVTKDIVDIDALGHDETGVWQSNANGHYKTCKRQGCNATILAAAHDYSDKTYSWNLNDDGKVTCTLTVKCGICGYTLVSDLKKEAGTPEHVNPTCVDEGYDLYTVDFGDYGKYAKYIMIAKLGHDPVGDIQSDATGHWFECSRCTDTLQKTAHHMDEITEDNYEWSSDYATCTFTGTCDDCGYTITDTVNTTPNIKKDAKTCVEAGIIEYSAQSSMFGSEAVKTEAPIAPEHAAHKAGEAWLSDGTNHWHVCEYCSEELASTKVAHTAGEYVFTWNADETACEAVSKCTVCEKELSKLAATITPSADASRPATCSQKGWTKYVASINVGGNVITCSDVKYKENIDKLEHQYSTDYKTDGTNHWKECSICFAKKENAAHTYGSATPSWGTANNEVTCTLTGRCTVCNKAKVVNANIISTISKTSTCDEPGVKTYYASADGFGTFTKTEAIAKKGHNFDLLNWKTTEDGKHYHECKNEGCTSRSLEDNHSYSAVAYVWSKDAQGNWKCAASKACTVCGFEVKENSTNVAVEVLKEATLKAVGSTRYTASFTTLASTSQDLNDREMLSFIDEGDGFYRVDADALKNGVELIDLFRAAALKDDSVSIAFGDSVFAFNQDAVASIGYKDSAFLKINTYFSDLSKYSKSGDTKSVVEISLTANGEELEFDGIVKISVPYMTQSGFAKQIGVYYVNGENLEECNSVLVNGVLTFTATHFSTYAVIDQFCPLCLEMIVIYAACAIVLACAVVVICVVASSNKRAKKALEAKKEKKASK